MKVEKVVKVYDNVITEVVRGDVFQYTRDFNSCKKGAMAIILEDSAGKHKDDTLEILTYDHCVSSWVSLSFLNQQYNAGVLAYLGNVNGDVE